MSGTPADQAVIWRSDFRRAFRIGERAFRNWMATKVVPAPDGNILGRDFWLPETYERAKAEILSGKHSRVRRPPHISRNKKLAG
jgi:hypothetical protein